MPVKMSSTYDAVRKRLKRLPRLVEGVASAARMRDADALIKTWREGLVGNSFGLRALAPRTVLRKARRGYSNPFSPLYGLGMDGARTYVKGMRKFRTRNGWSVRMVKGRHHESKLTLAHLFAIHENGCTIDMKDRTVVIPARPAMAAAYAKVMIDIAGRDDSALVQAAAMKYALTGAEPASGGSSV